MESDREPAGPGGPAPKRTAAHLRLGAYGENLAAAHLRRDGMRVLDRNWRCGSGELDIVASDRGVTVFCEVKTRRSLRFGTPMQAIDDAKAARIRRLATIWQRQRTRDPQLSERARARRVRQAEYDTGALRNHRVPAGRPRRDGSGRAAGDPSPSPVLPAGGETSGGRPERSGPAANVGGEVRPRRDQRAGVGRFHRTVDFAAASGAWAMNDVESDCGVGVTTTDRSRVKSDNGPHQHGKFSAMDHSRAKSGDGSRCGTKTTTEDGSRVKSDNGPHQRTKAAATDRPLAKDDNGSRCGTKTTTEDGSRAKSGNGPHQRTKAAATDRPLAKDDNGSRCGTKTTTEDGSRVDGDGKSRRAGGALVRSRGSGCGGSRGDGRGPASVAEDRRRMAASGRCGGARGAVPEVGRRASVGEPDVRGAWVRGLWVVASAVVNVLWRGGARAVPRGGRRRFDVVCVVIGGDGTVTIDHRRGVL